MTIAIIARNPFTKYRYIFPMDPKPVLEFDAVMAHFSTAMMVTHSDRGLHARPMHILKFDSDHSVWVASQLHCAKCQEIQKDHEVLLTLQGVNRWLSFNGTADIVTDKRVKDTLWSEGLKPYFPKGKDDPELSFIHVKPKFGEYWDFSGLQGLQFYWEAGKGWLTGKKANPEAAGKHAKVELTSQAAH